jgi:predicted restriction endonuclease
MQSRISIAKAAFKKKKKKKKTTMKKDVFTIKLDLHLKKKLVKCYIWSIALCGAETWTLRKVDQKYMKILKCGAGEEWRRSVGPIV